MKKVFSLIIVCLTTISTWAYDVYVDGIHYNLDKENMTAEVSSGMAKYSGSIIIPETIVSGCVTYTVTSIGRSAFFGCSDMTSVTIGNSAKNIGTYAFSGCFNMTSVIIGDSVETIGVGAFESCWKLTSFTIPNSVKVIGNLAFSFCSGLTSLTIGSSVTYIDFCAFNECKKLKEIHCKSTTPPNCGQEVFREVKTYKCNLYVPKGSKEAYSNAGYWGYFKSIIEE